jgi:hypothetical protein
MNSKNSTPEDYGHLVIPDLRQSICHTLVAAGFILANLQNPVEAKAEGPGFHLVFMLILAVAVVFSWLFFYRRFSDWKKIPSDIRSRATQSPAALKNRAVSHLLMALLAFGLTALGYIGKFSSLDNPTVLAVIGNGYLLIDIIVAVFSLTILVQTLRDLAIIKGFL